MARILFVSGVWVPASGGSEISAHTLTCELRRLGHDVVVLTGPSFDSRVGEEFLDQVLVRRVREADLESAFQDELARRRPQIVLTQLMWSERVLLWANIAGLPTVYFLRSEGPTVDLSDSSPLAPTAIVANSPTTRAYAHRQWRRDAPVVLPLVRLSDYVVQAETRQPTYITMFNPIREKGGELFRELAASLPDRRFLAVEGWHHWKRPDGTWDLQRLASSARSYGSHVASPPEVVPLDDLPQVETLSAVSDVRPIYARTRVLVVPSVWAEPFGRVILEAMVNGIPVLYSGTGSSDLAASGAGLRIGDANRAEAWSAALATLDEPHAYDHAADACRRRADAYDMDAEVGKVHDLVTTLTDRNDQ